jgi:hypothetical protein
MSILSIRNLYKKILAPILLLPEKRGKEKDARVIVHRRVEVTVERETISVIVPGQRPASADQAASRHRDLRGSRPELPALPALDEAADSDQAKFPEKPQSD